MDALEALLIRRQFDALAVEIAAHKQQSPHANVVALAALETRLLVETQGAAAAHRFVCHQQSAAFDGLVPFDVFLPLFDALNHETSSQPLARQFALEQVKRLADELQARTAANCSDADTRTVANLHDTYEKVLELTIFHVFVAHGESEQARRLIEADQWLGEQKKQLVQQLVQGLAERSAVATQRDESFALEPRVLNFTAATTTPAPNKMQAETKQKTNNTKQNSSNDAADDDDDDNDRPHHALVSRLPRWLRGVARYRFTPFLLALLFGGLSVSLLAALVRLFRQRRTGVLRAVVDTLSEVVQTALS